jgi:DNA-binding phage protein
MHTPKLRAWDSSTHLKSEKDINLYWETSLQEAGNDKEFIKKVIQNIDKATKRLPLTSSGS